MSYLKATHQSPVSGWCRLAPPGAPRCFRRAFTFTEVMFAVVILGIGFIMIAAVFPIAIRMNSQSAEETLSITTVDRSLASLRASATDALFPPTAFEYPTSSYSSDTNTSKYYAPYIGLGEAVRDSAGNWPLGPGPADPAATIDAAWRQWISLRGNLVSSTDGRIGLAVAYARRGTFAYTPAAGPTKTSPADSMDMVVVVAQSRDAAAGFNNGGLTAPAGKRLRDLTVPLNNASNQYTLSGTTPTPNYEYQFLRETSGAGVDNGTPATLQFKRLQARFFQGDNGAADYVELWAESDGVSVSWSNSAMMTTGSVTGVGPGTFLIIANASHVSGMGGAANPTRVKVAGGSPSPINAPNARANGRVVRLGRLVSDLSPSLGTPARYELVLGQDITTMGSELVKPPYGDSTVTAPPAVEVLALGRALQDPTKPFSNSTLAPNPYVGPPMDVAVYSMTVGIRK